VLLLRDNSFILRAFYYYSGLDRPPLAPGLAGSVALGLLWAVIVSQLAIQGPVAFKYLKRYAACAVRYTYLFACLIVRQYIRMPVRGFWCVG
jgi:hypothetical protein